MLESRPEIEPTESLEHEGFLRRLFHDPVGVSGAVMIGLVLIAAVFGPLLAPHDPTTIYVDSRLAPPGGQFLLGADELGRDVLSRVLHGARISIQVGLIVVVGASVIGVTIGLIAGFYRGFLDGLLMRIMDSIFAFPTLLLALAVIAVLGTDLRNLILALVVVYIPAFARIARSATLTVMQEPYLEAARSLGARNRRILVKHVLPNIAAPITVQFTIGLAYAILVEASLSYLGLGVQPPAASWGSMLATGKPYIEFAPWVSLVPGFCIMFTVLGFNLLGDAMRDSLDPRLRTVHDG